MWSKSKVGCRSASLSTARKPKVDSCFFHIPSSIVRLASITNGTWMWWENCHQSNKYWFCENISWNWENRNEKKQIKENSQPHLKCWHSTVKSRNRMLFLKLKIKWRNLQNRIENKTQTNRLSTENVQTK